MFVLDAIKDGVDIEDNSDKKSCEHPNYYNKGGIECIDGIKSSMSNEAFKGFLKGNVLKYVWRYESKEKPLQDLEKARVYLDWLIREIENGKDC